MADYEIKNKEGKVTGYITSTPSKSSYSSGDDRQGIGWLLFTCPIMGVFGAIAGAIVGALATALLGLLISAVLKAGGDADHTRVFSIVDFGVGLGALLGGIASFAWAVKDCLKSESNRKLIGVQVIVLLVILALLALIGFVAS